MQFVKNDVKRQELTSIMEKSPEQIKFQDSLFSQINFNAGNESPMADPYQLDMVAEEPYDLPMHD